MPDSQETDKSKPASTIGKVFADKSLPNDGTVADGTTSVGKLTPEEQMALYEKELKENDWGHQPC